MFFINRNRTEVLLIAAALLAIAGYLNFRVRGGFFNKGVFIISVIATVTFLVLPYLDFNLLSHLP